MKPHFRLSELYKKLRNQTESMAAHCFTGLSKSDVQLCEAHGFSVYQGKVREMILRPDDALMLHTDRLSAFDRFIGNVPYKGQILAAISHYWLQQISTIVPTHLLGQPHPRVLKVKRAKPFKVEVVVRDYLAGSLLRAYQNKERKFCGISLPENLRAYEQLKQPIITPTTKAEVYQHDENISVTDLLAQGICTDAQWQTIESLAFKIYALGQQQFARCGWLLADTKYEFGLLPDGDIIVIDEVHTPDSSRLWVQDSYAKALSQGETPQMLDKENVRRWLLDHKFSGQGEVPSVPDTIMIDLADVYLQVAEKLLGTAMSVAASEPQLPLEEILNA